MYTPKFSSDFSGGVAMNVVNLGRSVNLSNSMHSNSFMKSTHVPFGVCHRWPIKNLLEFVGFESAADA